MKSPRIVQLAMFAMVVFGGAGTAFADTYSFTTINVPEAGDTIPQGINNSGQIVGVFDHGFGDERGFVDTGGSFTTIDFPGAKATFLNGINDSGQIVATNPTGGFGLLYTAGSFTTINFPGATSTGAGEINDSGQIVGGTTTTPRASPKASFTPPAASV